VSLPALFVIDRAGTLRARYAGAIDSKAQTNLYKQITELLK
jgi:hypothetical protein